MTRHRATRSDKPASTFAWIRRGALSNLAFPLAALITSPILARALEADGRGALAAVTVPFLIAVNTFTLGLPESLTLHLARRSVSRRQLLVLGVWLPVAVGVVVASVAIALMPRFLVNYPDLVWLGRALFVLLPFGIAVQTLRGVAFGAGEYRLIFVERYLSVGLRLLPLIGLLLLGLLTVSTAAALTAAGIVSGVALVVAFRRVRRGWTFPAEPVRSKVVLRYGIAVWLGSVSQFLMFRVDQLILATLVPAAALGAYAVAVSLAEVSNSVTNAIREIIFSRASSNNDAAFVATGCRLAVALGLAGAVAGSVATRYLMVPVFGPSFEAAIVLTQILLVASIGSGLGAVVGAGLAASGRPGFWSSAQFVGLVLTLALIVPAVDAFGPEGAALLSAIAYWATALIGVVTLRRASGLGIRHYLVPTMGDVRRVARRPAATTGAP